MRADRPRSDRARPAAATVGLNFGTVCGRRRAGNARGRRPRVGLRSNAQPAGMRGRLLAAGSESRGRLARMRDAPETFGFRISRMGGQPRGCTNEREPPASVQRSGPIRIHSIWSNTGIRRDGSPDSYTSRLFRTG